MGHSTEKWGSTWYQSFIWKKKIMIVTDVYLLQYVFIADFGMLNSLLAYEIYKEHKKNARTCLHF